MRLPRADRGWGWPTLGALAAAVILVVAGVLVAIFEERLYSEQRIKDLTEQARILAASVTAAVVFDDRRAAQEYVDALTVNPDLEAAGVYTGDSPDALAGFTRRGAGPVPPRPSQSGVTYSVDQINLVVPVSQNARQVGMVYLRATAEPLPRRLARYTGLMLLVTMGALILGVLGFSQAALTRANLALHHRADELADLNLKLQDEMEERRKTEEALRQSHKMEAIGQLSGGIAHDFNNLITIVKGSLRLLRKRMVEPGPEAERYMNAAEDGLDRAASLTQRILAFSRRQPLTPKPARLSQLVSGMTELLRHSAGERVTMETRLESDWWTQCDVNQMENVILNLAINARDAMPEGGRLVIATRDVTLDAPPGEVDGFVPGDFVEVSVRDTGTGMTEDVRRRAIDPFFTTKDQGKGTGLGLSMSFGFVRQSGGHMLIDSAPDEGTTIRMLMPRHAMPEGAEAGTAS